MQVVAASAMEIPSRRDPDLIKNAQVAVFHAVADADPAHYVRGQYEGYLDVDGVAPGSTTETYAALRLEIENWRWAGVPFFIRTGKLLAATQTELRLVFKHAPKLGFQLRHGPPEPNQLVVKLDPSTGIQFTVEAHRADQAEAGTVELDMEFSLEGGEGPTPYEVLLHAALVGDSTRFTRQDGVEETWRIMQPLLDAPPRPTRSSPGTAAGTGPGSRHDHRNGSAAAAERRCAVAVPADRGLRVPLELPHGRVDRTRRCCRLVVPSELRRAECLREPPRPSSRLFPARPVRDQSSDCTSL
jgi:glucose-6-phosphate 1-dehydrogenase